MSEDIKPLPDLPTRTYVADLFHFQKPGLFQVCEECRVVIDIDKKSLIVEANGIKLKAQAPGETYLRQDKTLMVFTKGRSKSFELIFPSRIQCEEAYNALSLNPENDNPNECQRSTYKTLASNLRSIYKAKNAAQQLLGAFDSYLNIPENSEEAPTAPEEPPMDFDDHNIPLSLADIVAQADNQLEPNESLDLSTLEFDFEIPTSSDISDFASLLDDIKPVLLEETISLPSPKRPKLVLEDPQVITMEAVTLGTVNNNDENDEIQVVNDNFPNPIEASPECIYLDDEPSHPTMIYEQNNFEIHHYSVEGLRKSVICVFPSSDRKLCYEFHWCISDQIYQCKACLYLKKKYTRGELRDATNGGKYFEIKNCHHACSMVPYMPLKFQGPKIIRKPFYRVIDRQANQKSARRLYIFDENQADQCLEYLWIASLRGFRCFGCDHQSQYRSKARLLKDATGEEYVEIAQSEVKCKYKTRMLLTKDHFTVGNNGTREILTIKDPQNPQRKYVYYWQQRNLNWQCNGCHQKHRATVAKYIEDPKDGDFIICHGFNHICDEDFEMNSTEPVEDEEKADTVIEIE